MKKKIVIIGAGGFGREVFHLINRKDFSLIGFIDHQSYVNCNLPLPILGDDTLIPELKKRKIASSVCIALGDVKKRKAIFEIALQSDLKLPPIIHSSAVIFTRYPISAGVIIYPNVVIMNDCRIGQGVLLNSGVTLGHDVQVGDFSNINPGAHLAGRIKVGQQVFIGLGACIRDNVKIGNESTVGAGSVVLNDVASNTIVYGVPARPHK